MDKPFECAEPPKLSSRELMLLWIIIAASLVPRIYFFRAELWAWDSGEFAVAVDTLMFPHAPYPGYLALGLIFKYILPFSTDLTLSLISLVFGTAATIPFFYIARRWLFDNSMALVGAFLFAFAPILINQSGYQEIYSVQCFLVLFSIVYLIAGGRRAYWISAIAFGASVTVNVADIFMVPFFFAFMLVERWRIPKMVAWFAIAAGVEFATVFWTLIEFGSIEKTMEYWFMSKETHGLMGAITGVETQLLAVPKILFTKGVSLVSAMFSPFTHVLTVIGFIGFPILLFKNRRTAFLLFAFAFPYMVFDSTFPVKLRAVGLYLTFFLPVMAMLGAVSILYLVRWRPPFKSLRLVASAAVLLLFLFQSATSSHLPGPLTTEQYLYDLHGYLNWIPKVIPEGSMLITEREPWIVRYYVDRDTVYSGFRGSWDKDETGLSIFPKSRKIATANDHISTNLNKICDEIREGVPVFSTTYQPFKESRFTGRVGLKGEKEFLVVDMYDIYKEKAVVKEQVQTVFHDDFTSDIYAGESARMEKLIRYVGSGEAYVHPVEKDISGSVLYSLEYPLDVVSMLLDLKMVISRPDNYIRLFVVDKESRQKTIRTFEMEGENGVKEVMIDLLKLLEGTKPTHIGLELFVDDSNGGGVIGSRLLDVAVRTTYMEYPEREVGLYRLSLELMRTYLFDDFSTEEFRDKSVASKKLAFDLIGGFIYPVLQGEPAELIYRIASEEAFVEMVLAPMFYVIGDNNYAELYISDNGKEYKRIYLQEGGTASGYREAVLNISENVEGRREFFVKIVLVKGGAAGPLIDSRLESIKVYSSQATEQGRN